DQVFVEQVKTTLRQQGKWKTANVGRRQARRILELLEKAEAPSAQEPVSLSDGKAVEDFENNKSFTGIFVADGQQPMELQTWAQFLGEHYDNDAKVFVQDPRFDPSKTGTAVREVTIGQVKQH